MSKKNMAQSPTKNKSAKEIMPESKATLVFLTHGTRDAELAEEFSILLEKTITPVA